MPNIPQRSEVVFSHPLGTDDIRIRNPHIIAKSSWGADDLEWAKSSIQTDDFEVCADPNPTNTSTGSDEAFALARRWIDKCAETHENCEKRPSSPRRVPQRLLGVTQAVDRMKGVVRLVKSAERVSGSSQMLQYVTLSHRWNTEFDCSTKESNIYERETQGIEMALLPKRFAEACVTVKKLGLIYLWIDSLCIIQDSKADQDLEIPNMADYYQNAEVNLSASTESIEGLWSDREGEAVKPFKIKATLELPDWRRRVVLELAPVLRADKSHLDYRGWILQERIFPRRTTFFDPYWISFECSQMSASESCPDGTDLTFSSNSVAVESVLATQLDRDCSLTVMGGKIRSIDAIRVLHS